MNITLTSTADGFELAHPRLPAALQLSREAGIGLAKALASDEVKTPAFKTDKNVFAPQTREPVGLWVMEDGTIELWFAGESEKLTQEEAAQLAGDVLLASAEFKVGDEIEQAEGSLLKFAESDLTQENYKAAASAGTFPAGSILKVAEVGLKNGEPGYRLTDGTHYTLIMPANYVRATPPIQNYRVERSLHAYAEDVVMVQARSLGVARQLGLQVKSRKGYEVSDISSIEVITKTDEELNAEEGFVVNPDGSLGLTKDSQHATPADLNRFLIDQAFAGSRRHQGIVRSAMVAV